MDETEVPPPRVSPEPGSIMMLLIILVLSIGLDFWWKRGSVGRVTHVHVGH
jgi:hypothetical protein